MRSDNSGHLVTMKELLDEAEKGSYAVGAYNVSDLNQAYAVLEAANDERSPVIIQAIVGMHSYSCDDQFWRMLRQLIVSEAQVPVALHLDHGKTFDDCRRAIEAGFTSVMRDASRDATTGEALDFDKNVEETLRTVEYARTYGVTVEGEIGTVGGGGETGENYGAFDYSISQPDDAITFAKVTGVDALALAVGTSHGSVKFPPGRQPELDYNLIRTVHRDIPATALVLHGSSTAFALQVDRINAAGGKVNQSSGITPEDKRKAVECGIRKINQGTDSHLAFTAAMREYLRDHPGDVDPAMYMAPGIHGMKDAVAASMRVFGSAGRVNGPD